MVGANPAFVSLVLIRRLFYLDQPALPASLSKAASRMPKKSKEEPSLTGSTMCCAYMLLNMIILHSSQKIKNAPNALSNAKEHPLHACRSDRRSG
jgi:hypothetical protein